MSLFFSQRSLLSTISGCLKSFHLDEDSSLDPNTIMRWIPFSTLTSTLTSLLPIKTFNSSRVFTFCVLNFQCLTGDWLSISVSTKAKQKIRNDFSSLEMLRERKKNPLTSRNGVCCVHRENVFSEHVESWKRGFLDQMSIHWNVSMLLKNSTRESFRKLFVKKS